MCVYLGVRERLRMPIRTVERKTAFCLAEALGVLEGIDQEGRRTWDYNNCLLRRLFLRKAVCPPVAGCETHSMPVHCIPPNARRVT